MSYLSSEIKQVEYYLVLEDGTKRLILSREDGTFIEIDISSTSSIPLMQKGVANGVATLDVEGKVLSAQLPSLSIGEAFVVASQVAMLALTAQRGDFAVRTDLDPDGFFLLTADAPGTLANWVQITAPGGVTSVDGQTGAVSFGITLVVKAVETTNVALLGLQVVDGYQTVAGSVVLLVGQTTASQNGPWVVAAGAWSRPTWFSSASSQSGRSFTIIGGTSAGALWTLETISSIVVDTTAQVWRNTPQVGGYVAGLGRINTIETWGHSYMSGHPVGGTTAAALKSLLGAKTLVDRSTGGDQIYRVFTAARLDYLTPPNGVLQRSSGEATVQVASIMFGINDTRVIDTTVSGNIERFGKQLQILISLVATKPGDRYNALHSSFTYGAQWFTTTGSTVQKVGLTGYGPITWTSWAGFPGGYVSFALYVSNRANAGGLHTFTLNGVAKGSVDTRNTSFPVPYGDYGWYDTVRIYVPPDTVGGQQVIVDTIASGATGNLYFHGMALERGPSPIIPVLKQPYPIDYTIMAPGTGLPIQPTDAIVDLFNAQIDTVVASFNDARIFAVDLNKVFARSPALFVGPPDKLHPSNPAGVRTMLTAIIQSVKANPAYSNQPLLP